MTTPSPEREQLARIIAPKAWVALGTESLAQLNRRTASLRTADKIIAAGYVHGDGAMDETTFLMTLAELGVPADIQELLVRGNPAAGIKPGALRAALAGPVTEEKKPANWPPEWHRPADCHEMGCGGYIMKTEPPMNPPLIGCNNHKCWRMARAQSTTFEDPHGPR